MVTGCEKLLKPILNHCEYLNIDKKSEVYDKILSSFLQEWTSILFERKKHPS